MTWTEKTILKTGAMLPGVLNRAEVASIAYEQISPISNAIDEVTRAAKNLRSLASGRGGDAVDVKHLGTAINGAVDSPINGGVKLYRETFLDPSYVDEHPQETIQIEELRIVILDYVRSIQEGLAVHRDLCREMSFHEALKSHFFRAFPDETSLLPGGPDSLESAIRPIPSITGHVDRNSSPLTPTIHSPSRHSTISETSTGFVLPPLRLGPTPSPVGMGSLRRPPSLPMTASSSPHLLATSRSSGRSSVSNPNGAPSLGSRAMSFVGSFSGRSGTSEGTAGEEVIAEEGAEGVKKEKGLKRFGSLMRKK